MAEETYYTVRSTHHKSTTFTVNMKSDKRKKPENRQIKIEGSFPRPNPSHMKPGVSYLSGAEKAALELEPSYQELEQNGKLVLHEIPFKDLPEELQIQYDPELYKQIKAEKVEG